MQGKTPVLTAVKRDLFGSRHTTRIRAAGGLPAIVYGHKAEPLAVRLDARDALRHFHKGEKVFTLAVDGDKEPQTVLLKDLQFDHLGTHVIHCDLARVSLDEKVRVKVPVHLIGEAKGLKSAGAILMHPTNEVEIECRVTDIPDHVEVEIGELDVGHAITAAQVKLPLGDMKLKTDPHSIVAQIVIQQELKVEEEAAVDGAAAAEPEVITAKKKDEEGEEGAEAGKDGKPAAKGAAPAAKGTAPAKGAAPPKAAAPAGDKKAAPAAEKKK
ncbi:MAG: 50S ribosomal protein L25 [Phycisphaerales bacterium]